MRITVIGGSGQVGAPLVRRLRVEGYQVINIDLADGTDANDRRSLYEDLFESDFCYFLAFDVGGSTYLKEYQKTFNFVHNNVELMETVFDALQYTQVPFIFTSSQMSNMSHSPYGVLKRVGEFYTNSLEGLNVRFWNVFGHESNPEKFHVVTDFINMAKNDGLIKIRTTGQEQRQFLHTDDCTEALFRLMLDWELLDLGCYYDVTSFKWSKIIDVADIVAEKFGAMVEIGTEIDTVQGVVNEPEDRILDLWEPKLSLEQGIEKVIYDMELKW